MLHNRKIKISIAVMLCLCIFALFALSSAAGVHSGHCIRENCRICTFVHSSSFSVALTGGNSQQTSAFVFAVQMASAILLLTCVSLLFITETPVKLGTRIDI